MKGEYYKTKESVDEYISLAKDVNGLQLIEQLKAFLPVKSRLLELGSGPGTDWEILSQLYEVTGSDFSSEFLNRLISRNPESSFLELDAITLETKEKFDAIYSNKVLHHLKLEELSLSIQRQNEILNPQGIICHSFWSGEGSEIFKGLFVNYHSISSLEKAFSTYFDILSIEPYREFEDEDSLLLIGRKK